MKKIFKLLTIFSLGLASCNSSPIDADKKDNAEYRIEQNEIDQDTLLLKEKPTIIIKGKGRFIRNINNPIEIFLANRDSIEQQIGAFISPNGVISGNAVSGEFFVKPITGDSITIRLGMWKPEGLTFIDSTRFKIYEE